MLDSQASMPSSPEITCSVASLIMPPFCFAIGWYMLYVVQLEAILAAFHAGVKGQGQRRAASRGACHLSCPGIASTMTTVLASSPERAYWRGLVGVIRLSMAWCMACHQEHHYGLGTKSCPSRVISDSATCTS